jgi:hypothetical protein
VTVVLYVKLPRFAVGRAAVSCCWRRRTRSCGEPVLRRCALHGLSHSPRSAVGTTPAFLLAGRRSATTALSTLRSCRWRRPHRVGGRALHRQGLDLLAHWGRAAHAARLRLLWLGRESLAPLLIGIVARRRLGACTSAARARSTGCVRGAEPYQLFYMASCFVGRRGLRPPPSPTTAGAGRHPLLACSSHRRGALATDRQRPLAERSCLRGGSARMNPRTGMRFIDAHSTST